MSKDSVNLLVTSDVGEDSIHRLRAFSPKVNLKDATSLVQAELHGDNSRKAELDALLAQAEVIYGCFSHLPGSDLPRNLIARAPKLKWLHSLSAGVDSFLDPKEAVVTDNTAIANSSVIVTNASGIHTAPMAELALAMMLMFAKKAWFLYETKKAKKWEAYIPAVLRGKTLGILGLGYGQEVARLGKALGMNVVAIKKPVKPGEKVRYVDTLLSGADLPKLLATSDYVVVLLPLTKETTNMIGEKELKMMKPTAYLINISRGRIVDEDALIKALEQKWIAGAGLDVFKEEPLPVNNKLWGLPNVIYAPHVGGDFDDYYKVGTDLFLENLRRYLEGKRLLNVIDKKLVYQTSGPKAHSFFRNKKAVTAK